MSVSECCCVHLCTMVHILVLQLLGCFFFMHQLFFPTKKQKEHKQQQHLFLHLETTTKDFLSLCNISKAGGTREAWRCLYMSTGISVCCMNKPSGLSQLNHPLEQVLLRSCAFYTHASFLYLHQSTETPTLHSYKLTFYRFLPSFFLYFYFGFWLFC